MRIFTLSNEHNFLSTYFLDSMTLIPIINLIEINIEQIRTNINFTSEIEKRDVRPIPNKLEGAGRRQVRKSPEHRCYVIGVHEHSQHRCNFKYGNHII